MGAMGSLAAPLLGGLLGVGAAALLGRKQKSGSESNYQSISYQPSQTAIAATTPIDVAKTEEGTTNNALMEEEREKERQAALLRQQRNQTILTSGLGAAGVANTQKKTLLGG